MKRWRLIGAAVLIVTMLVLSACGGSGKTKIRVAGKDYTEQEILVYIVGLLLKENPKLDVEMVPYLGGTNIMINAIKQGSVDVYTEYTGTAFANVLRHNIINDPAEVLRVVREQYPTELGMEFIEPLGFNNTYVIGVTRDVADRYQLKTVSDLAQVANQLIIGTDPIFIDRPDGLPGLEKTYNMKFKEVVSMNVGLKYVAMGEGKIDVTDAYSTDGQLTKQDVVLLEDDLHFFPPYEAVPVVRKTLLEKHPEIKDALLKLAGTLTDQQMAELNAKVDIDKRKAEDVAREWLKQQGLIK